MPLHYIASRVTSFGQTVILWQRHHYTYEIEVREKGYKVSTEYLDDTSFEDAMAILEAN